MRATRFFYLILFMFVTALGLGSPAPVYACVTGGTPTHTGYIERASIIVKGTPVAHQDGSTAIAIEVETYLKGDEDKKYLLIYPGTKGRLNGKKEKVLRYCSGRAKLNRVVGITSYYYLGRRSDGLYSGTSITFTGEPQSLMLLGSDNVPFENYMTEQEYVQYVKNELTNFESHLPTDTTYPRTGILRITTLDNRNYFLPVDDNQLENLPVDRYVRFINDHLYLFDDNLAECESIKCIKYTPNQVYLAALLKNNRILINWDEYSGHDLLFSPTSDAVVIWDNNQIMVNVLYLQSIFGYSTLGIPSPHSIKIQPNTMSDSLHTAWSPDGWILAFTDENGLWLWDALNENAEPELLIASNDIGVPFARYFSPMGRFLAIEHGNLRYNLDLVSGETLPDGLISPNERHLLAFDTFSDIFDLELCYLLTGKCISNNWVFYNTVITLHDGTRDGLVLHLSDFSEAEWVNETQFIISACGSYEEVEYCGASYNKTDGLFGSGIATLGRNYDFEPISQVFASIYDDYTISIYHQKIDLSDQLDSPIVKIEWLPSFFYRE